MYETVREQSRAGTLQNLQLINRALARWPEEPTSAMICSICTSWLRIICITAFLLLLLVLQLTNLHGNGVSAGLGEGLDELTIPVRECCVLVQLYCSLTALTMLSGTLKGNNLDRA
jgi:hypothetical protein